MRNRERWGHPEISNSRGLQSPLDPVDNGRQEAARVPELGPPCRGWNSGGPA